MRTPTSGASPASRSKFVTRARELRPGLLSALWLEPVVLKVSDVIVSVCEVLMNEDDDRPWQDKVEKIFRELFPDDEAIKVGLEAIADESSQEAIMAWVDKVQRVGYQAFARRLLGAAEYHRLEAALKEDAALVALAVRRGVQAAMPLVVAFEDGLELMTAQQLAQIKAVDLANVNFGDFLRQVDLLLTEQVWPNLPMETVPGRPADNQSLTEMADQIRAKVTSSAHGQLKNINEPLVRKLVGARDALRHSADGVSQAASSLIELIDRILRDSIEPNIALDWVQRELPNRKDLSFCGQNGERRLATRGAVLFFLYSGGSVKRPATEHDDGTGPTFLHEALASVVVVARTKLQRLKHADEATVDDREQLEQLLAAVEGALWIGLWLHQLSDPADTPQGPSQETQIA